MLIIILSGGRRSVRYRNREVGGGFFITDEPQYRRHRSGFVNTVGVRSSAGPSLGWSKAEPPGRFGKASQSS